MVVSDHQYISALGFPLMPTHPARMVGGPLEVAQLRQLAGQSVDRDMTATSLRCGVFQVLEKRGLTLAGTTITYGDWFSGGSFVGATMWEVADALEMDFVYAFAIEGLRLAQDGHRYGWCGKPLGVFHEVCDVTAEQLRPLFPPGGIIAAGGRCAPFACASATHQPGTEKKDNEKGGAIFEFTRAVEVSMELEPNAVFFETSDAIRTDKRHVVEWRAMQAVCMAHRAHYDWSWQTVCPKVLLSKPMPRKRLYIIATRWVPIAIIPASTAGADCGDDTPLDVEMGEATSTVIRCQGVEVTFSARLLEGAPAGAVDAGPRVGAPVDPVHELRTLRGSTISRRCSLRGSAKVGDFTNSGQDWRTAPITLLAGEPGTLVERRAGGRWEHFCLIAPSLHLLEQGISGGGYFNLQPRLLLAAS